MAKNDGGPAFPMPVGAAQYSEDGPNGAVTVVTKWNDAMVGMSLRDHFAGQALIANRLTAPDAASSEVAGMSWADADAMLAEREKRDAE